MEEKGFTHGSPTHLITLVGCVLLTLLVTWWGKRSKKNPAQLQLLRRLVAAGSILSWLATLAYGLFPSNFSWDSSLPLHFCNLGNLIGAVAVLYQKRGAQSLLYFWSISLCIWAFLTPFLLEGPTHLWFWLFWIYHLFIPICLFWTLIVDGFQPGWKDLRFALIATTLFTLSLAGINAMTGWDYGFVGPGKPGQPSPIDLLGPYPLRIAWMLMIGSVLFTLLLLPWRIRWKKCTPSH